MAGVHTRVRPAKVYAVGVAGAPGVGPAAASLTVVIAYEYACPWCNKQRQAFAQIREVNDALWTNVFDKRAFDRASVENAVTVVAGVDRARLRADMDGDCKTWVERDAPRSPSSASTGRRSSGSTAGRCRVATSRSRG